MATVYSSTSTLLCTSRIALSQAYKALHTSTRAYAQVGATTFVGEPPSPPASSAARPDTTASSPPSTPPIVKPFDAHVLWELRRATLQGNGSSRDAPTPLTELVEQYMKRAGHVLDVSLPYESRPNATRRATVSPESGKTVGDIAASNADGALVMVAHAVHDRTGKHRVVYSTGFAVHAPGLPEGQSLLVTCAHTLEEIRHDPLMRAARPSPAVPSDQLLSGSFAIAGSSSAPTFRPVRAILSAMHRGDLVLLAAPSALPPTARASGSEPHTPLRSLPVNPYPVHPGTPIRAHFVAERPPEHGPAAERDGWTPWIGGTWRKWARGTVVGYRDYAGREAKPGTYDSLAHLHFDPPPTAGSSGGPIIDEESGSVIGVILGTQLVNQVEGVKGWGVPSEMIFEMFSLPGLKAKD